MKTFNFDYKKIIEQTDALNTVSEKIYYLKTVLKQIDEFNNSLEAFKEKPELMTTEERLKYFESLNLKKLVSTKILIEEHK